MDGSGSKVTAACVQLRAGRETAPNIDRAWSLIREAHGQGAELIATPENTSLMELKTKLLFEKVSAEDDDPALAAFKALASELRVHLLIGSLPIRVSDTQIANRSYMIGPSGEILTRYDKIHMFDVDLPGGESYRESKNYRAGNEAVAVDLPWGRLGMTICYDLRFPHLYRRLAQEGVSILTVPSAFTKQTGEAHWHVLLRARAIECGCFVLAPAQGGVHENGRVTYGHSLIIDPWGEILAEGGKEPGVILAELDMSAVSAARQRIPSLTHDRAILGAQAGGAADD